VTIAFLFSSFITPVLLKTKPLIYSLSSGGP
jgi:hypothetical protein